MYPDGRACPEPSSLSRKPNHHGRPACRVARPPPRPSGIPFGGNPASETSGYQSHPRAPRTAHPSLRRDTLRLPDSPAGLSQPETLGDPRQVFGASDLGFTQVHIGCEQPWLSPTLRRSRAATGCRVPLGASGIRWGDQRPMRVSSAASIAARRSSRLRSWGRGSGELGRSSRAWPRLPGPPPQSQ